MSDKFQRSYRIEIDLANNRGTIVITPPITINFSIRRFIGQSLNEMNLEIVNLSKDIRDRIYKDFYNPEDRDTVRVYGGYDNLSLMFKGDIWEANSSREGTEIVTSIYCKTGAWDINNSETYETISAGRTLKELFQTLIGKFENLSLGAVGEYDEVLQRPVVLNGNTYELLKKYADGDVFIDNDKVYVMKDKEYVADQINVINSGTGILQTPQRGASMLSITTLFDPSIELGSLVQLESSVEPVYNGTYKVLGMQHTGMISEAQSGAAVTKIDLLTRQQFSQVGV